MNHEIKILNQIFKDSSTKFCVVVLPEPTKLKPHKF